MEGKDLGYFTKKKIIFWKLVSVLKLLVEQTDTGCYNLCWLTVLADGAREEGTASRGRYPWELWDWQWDRLARPRLQQVGVPRDQDLSRFREIRTQIEVMKSEVMKLCRSTRLFLTPSSHSRKGRTGRGSTHSTCLIGGSQTVQRYRDSRTCCV